ncbi:chorismate mutase [Legionella maioricensis]|uniref:chorismate mutase n=1 Tax=Legionella maioricensis TaxID=2896528 RepID=A0A9X2D277_9GAMM|nr:chorismate mutase [Legionella maioricensis]MCL9685285.1 chorismate mutase [Legionella maioricensis]MCL9688540.1 chorismate mutase [Legionella maioricensis]
MATIDQLREQIQNTDLDIIKRLACRQNLCKKIAELKKQAGKQIIDREQEKKNFEFYKLLSKEYAIDPQFVARLFRLIIINSRTIQQQTIGEIDLS